MKCTNCNLLLSPAGTIMNCPHCGTSTVSDQETRRVSGLQNDQLRQTYGTQASNGERASILPAIPPKIGFTVAGLCIFAAALILLFVNFMAMGLSRNTSNGGSHATLTGTPSQSATPSPSTTPTEISLPGKHFIDKAQTATSVDISTGKPLGPNDTFAVNQKVYLSIHLHPAGHAGAVCLLWFLNGKRTTHYEFLVSPGDTVAYSFTTYPQPGTAYVDIYWAKTILCAGKLLAQHVTFTITA